MKKKNDYNINKISYKKKWMCVTKMMNQIRHGTHTYTHKCISMEFNCEYYGYICFRDNKHYQHHQQKTTTTFDICIYKLERRQQNHSKKKIQVNP